MNDGKEIIWASERDGWEHLYLYDGVTGQVKNQITKGDWVVRNVDRVDEAKRQIWFQAGGMNPGQDPYFTHYYRINFDGTGLIKLTEADGTHTLTFSPDRKYYVDTWQRVDLPPVVTAAQHRRPEGDHGSREGRMPPRFSPPASGSRKYLSPRAATARPTSGVPSSVQPISTRRRSIPSSSRSTPGRRGRSFPRPSDAVPGTQALAELGFIVVQIDGMGTSNRSKAFHDVAWKNLGDAGFPDRILWHKAVAAKYPYYDISRVGIYGTSAGGQNSMGGVLFHPEFYKVVVTNSGCHDNRMDKIWWNEQWMGWPLGPQYAASSNVDNAYQLVGKALIIIGEMDTNVDPASSLQVVNALSQGQEAVRHALRSGREPRSRCVEPPPDEKGRQFHFLQDYFVRHLLGVEPPDWNKVTLRPEESGRQLVGI